MTTTSRQRRTVLVSAGLLALLLLVWPRMVGQRPHTPANSPVVHRGAPAPLARWPWPKAVVESPHPGVTHWIDRSSPDGTVAELLDLDFQANPRLRLELYDQDEDDAVPFDDRVEFWSRGVGQVTRHLNETRPGRVVAAWNGLFFQYTGATASHVAPVVLNGKARYNVGVVRWAVGVEYDSGRPVFRVLRLPDVRTLAQSYDFAAEGASCLILNGRPLRLQPMPGPNDDPFPPSKPPAANEAGFVRKVDHIRTSRTSMGWSKDNRHFYLLIVKEPDAEAGSVLAFRDGSRDAGGWTVADLQRFWRQLGAWCAVNIDGGDVTQLAALRRDGRYDLVPPRWASSRMRLTLPPDLAGAPEGGSIMYFYVRDTLPR